MDAPLEAYTDGLRERDKAWMAGFIDGEGCLTISRQVRKGRPSPACRAYITIATTHRDVLQGFVERYGGRVYSVHERRGDKRGRKWADAYDWYCPVSSAEQLLVDVLPHLRIKRPQAEILLTFIRKKRAFERRFWPGRGKGSAPLTAEEISFREDLRIQVQLLNQKGQRARQALAGESDG